MDVQTPDTDLLAILHQDDMFFSVRDRLKKIPRSQLPSLLYRALSDDLDCYGLLRYHDMRYQHREFEAVWTDVMMRRIMVPLEVPIGTHNANERVFERVREVACKTLCRCEMSMEDLAQRIVQLQQQSDKRLHQNYSMVTKQHGVYSDDSRASMLPLQFHKLLHLSKLDVICGELTYIPFSLVTHPTLTTVRFVAIGELSENGIIGIGPLFQRLSCLSIGSPLSRLMIDWSWTMSWLQNLTVLELRDMTMDASEMDEFRKLRQLQVLVFDSCNLEMTDVFAELTELRALSFVESELSHVPIDALRSLKKLVYLDTTDVTTHCFDAVFPELPSLEVLRAETTHWTLPELLSFMPKLSVLCTNAGADLSYGELSDILHDHASLKGFICPSRKRVRYRGDVQRVTDELEPAHLFDVCLILSSDEVFSSNIEKVNDPDCLSSHLSWKLRLACDRKYEQANSSVWQLYHYSSTRSVPDVASHASMLARRLTA